MPTKQARTLMTGTHPSLALTLAALTYTLVLAGCGGSHAPATPALAAPAEVIDQTSLCEVKDYGPATSCKPGQKVVFLPASFGNEQLPILFAAINCDLRYQVVLTTGAVTCIYGPVKPSSN